MKYIGKECRDSTLNQEIMPPADQSNLDLKSLPQSTQGGALKSLQTELERRVACFNTQLAQCSEEMGPGSGQGLKTWGCKCWNGVCFNFFFCLGTGSEATLELAQSIRVSGPGKRQNVTTKASRLQKC